jgi:hypothetical protein
MPGLGFATGFANGLASGKMRADAKKDRERMFSILEAAHGARGAAGGGYGGGAADSGGYASSLDGDLGTYAAAIRGNESDGSGGYAAMGPETDSGDRAYGAYQVMGSNIGSWTEAALGRAMSPDEFLADPQAQDAVFQHRFGGYLSQYGNPQDAASVWFSGRPMARAGNASDGYMTVPAYVAKFERGVAAARGSGREAPAQQLEASETPAQKAGSWFASFFNTEAGAK